VIIGKLIPAATGLKRYRTIDIEPSEPLPLALPPEAEAELLAALEEIGDGDVDLDALGLSFEEPAEEPASEPEAE
jgi:DNA-directed RNA polymerase subunit beta'